MKKAKQARPWIKTPDGIMTTALIVLLLGMTGALFYRDALHTQSQRLHSFPQTNQSANPGQPTTH